MAFCTTEVSGLIDRVADGENARDALLSLQEKGTINIDSKDVKPQGKYDTPEKAARAIAAYIGRKKHGDAKMNALAKKGTKKYFKSK